MNEIKIKDDISICYGNMGFILKASGHEKLFNRCVELEQTLKSDYDAFAIKFRLVLEEFALSEETKKRIIKSNNHYNETLTRKIITNEVCHGNNGYSNMLVSLCLQCDNSSAIENLLKRQCHFQDNWNSDIFRDELQKHIRYLFRFASQNAHSGESSTELVPTNSLCRNLFKQLFYLLCAYYGVNAKYDRALVPFQDYYPIPKTKMNQLGIFLDNQKHLYVKNQNGEPKYYLFVPADSKIKDTQKRDIETIHKLWMENSDSPQNVILNPTFVSNKNGKDYCFWIYPLPSLPESITDTLIEKLTHEEKIQIIQGIIRGVASMHNSQPSFFHRNLSPAAFLLCKIKRGYKPLLINFDCVKDNDDAEFTVFYAVNAKMNNKEMKESIFAPELYGNDEEFPDEIDWSKVDIYALGKTIIKILTNSYTIPDNIPSINQTQTNMLISMCSSEPNDRPDVNVVLNAFI